MAEKEYIEREALIRYAAKQIFTIKDGTSVADALNIQSNVFRRCVELCPAADVVEVVRCKDCEWWKKQDDSAQGFCLLSQTYPTGYWYCANGERRKENDKTK